MRRLSLRSPLPALLIAFVFTCGRDAGENTKAGESGDAGHTAATVEHAERPDILDGRRYLFTGGAMRDSIHHVYGVRFHAVDSLRIAYRLSFLEDWEKRREIVDTAVLQTRDGVAQLSSIVDAAGKRRPSYRFVDKREPSHLIIDIEKTERRNSSIARAFERCDGELRPLTSILYAK